jgi:hypothetical protein
MTARQESKVTRLDLRIPNDIYAQVEEIAKANNEPTHHITGNIILTPTLVKLIRLGIRSLSDNYPTLADLTTASERVPDTLTPRMNAVEGELSELKKLVIELSDKISSRLADTFIHSETPGEYHIQPDTLSDNTTVSDLSPDNMSDIIETDIIAEDRPSNTPDNRESSLLPDSKSDIAPDTSETTENHATQSLSSESGTMSWTDFYRMIDEVLPQDLKRNKANSDRAIALAVDKGFDGWRYDSKVKNFIKP